MPHVQGHDPEDEIDYSAFEYQHIQFVHNADTENQNVTNTLEVSPLADRGGLDNDEVAELVAMRIHVTAGPDDLGGILGNDTAEGSYEYRWTFGSDIGREDTLPPSRAFTADADPGNERSTSNTDPAVFEMFDATAIMPFSDTAQGLGGGGTAINERWTVHFRDMVGRGPVLDAADNLNLVYNLIKNNVTANLEGVTRMTLIWDTSTIEGDRRQFSVP
jgi:hypothetical protein